MSKLDFRTSKPQQWNGPTGHDKYIVNYVGPCVVCGKRCYDNLGASYLEHSDNSLEAREFSMIGADVVICYYCANDSAKYQRAEAIAMSRWTREGVVA